MKHLLLAAASAVGAAMTAALLSGCGGGSPAAETSGGQEVPARSAAEVHARLGVRTIKSSPAATGEPQFGRSVALSADGKTALVGAPGVDHGKGAAYVFHVSSAGSWSSSETPTATLTYKKGAVDEDFGSGVALSADGTTAFVGDPDARGGDGAIYVFHVSGEDAWASSSTPAATLTVDGSYYVGDALALSRHGTTLVAGAAFYHNQSGGAFVFHASSEGAWASTSTPTATLSYARGDSSQDELVGVGVAISGDGTTALLSDSRNYTGVGAFVYHVDAENAWKSSSKPTAILSDAGTVPEDGYGFAVALSGDGTVALFGAFGRGRGTVDVFHASAEAAWASTSTPTATLTKAGSSARDFFGGGVAMSADGTTALVTAPGVDKYRGAAYVFHVSDAGAWASSSAPTATLTDSDGQAKDVLGGIGAPPALAADGATALLGAPGADSGTGAAHVFHVSDASSWS